MSFECNIPKAGEWLVGWYPMKNRTDEKSQSVQRNLCCLSVRDLDKDPLAIESAERRPFVGRGRYLMFAWDEDQGETRCFYLHKLAPRPDVESTNPPLQIVGFDPNDPHAGMEVCGPEFSDDTFMRATLATACRKLRLQGSSELYRVRAKGA